MGLIWALFLFVIASPLRGESDDSRKTIEAVLLRFNSAIARNDSGQLLKLFTETADYGESPGAPVPVKEALKQRLAKRLPWDERTPLRLAIRDIRFVLPGVAIAEATQSDSSPMLGSSRSWFCRFTLVRVGQEWKISSYREVATSPF